MHDHRPVNNLHWEIITALWVRVNLETINCLSLWFVSMHKWHHETKKIHVERTMSQTIRFHLSVLRYSEIPPRMLKTGKNISPTSSRRWVVYFFVLTTSVHYTHSDKQNLWYCPFLVWLLDGNIQQNSNKTVLMYCFGVIAWNIKVEFTVFVPFARPSCS